MYHSFENCAAIGFVLMNTNIKGWEIKKKVGFSITCCTFTLIRVDTLKRDYNKAHFLYR